MTKPKYPWSQLAVGESATVRSVPSRNAVHASLLQFRDRVLRSGLASPEHMPCFDLSWHPDGSLTITRREDGPVRRGNSPARDPAVLERRAILEALDAHITRQAHRLERGEARELVPLSLHDRARRLGDAWLSAHLAEVDFVPNLDALVGRKRRRATDDPATPIPQRTADPDLPRDIHLCSRLAHACRS